MQDIARKTVPYQLEFRRIGGSYQALIRNAEDLKLLLALDEAHWALNSISVTSMRCDEQFLAFLDDDLNGQIRTEEVKRAVLWFLGLLRDFRGFEEGSDTLLLSAINDSTPEGGRLLDAARLVLTNLGAEELDRITLAQIRNDKEIIACARRNGDGVIPPESADTPEAAELIEVAMKAFGSIRDASGSEGIDGTILDSFATAATAYLQWADAPAASPGTLLPFGDDTAAAYEKYRAVAAEVDNYFIACEALNFSSESTRRLGKVENTIDPLNNPAIRDFFSSAPPAEPNREEVLDFSTRLNPLQHDALRAFAEDVHLKQFLDGSKLSAQKWVEIREKFAPYASWLASRPEDHSGGADLETLRRLTEPERIAQLREMMEADLAVAPRIGACNQLHKLILFQNCLKEFLNNFVNLSCLFNPETPSLLQAGKLVMDGMCLSLCTTVQNPAEHKNIVQRSNICVIYLDARTGAPDAARTMKLAVAVTSRNINNFFIGKHGIFFAPDGALWDAKITDLVQQPVSISEALRMPFYKFGEFISNLADRFFSTKSQDAQKQLEVNLNSAATAATTPGALPGSATGAPAAQAKPQTPAVSGSMMLMGSGIGIAAIGSSIAFIVKQLAHVSIWNVLAVLLGIILIFGGPVVVVSLVKLYRRNLSRFLEANGVAVNRRMRLSRRMGTIFTYVPKLPRATFLKRDLVNYFSHPISNWPLRILLILLLAALCAWGGYWGFRWMTRSKSDPESRRTPGETTAAEKQSSLPQQEEPRPQTP